MEAPDRKRRLRSPRLALVMVLVVGLAGGIYAVAGPGGDSTPAKAQAERQAPPREEPGNFDLSTKPKVVELGGAQGAPQGGGGDDAPSPGAQSDEEVRAELKQANKELRSFESHLASAELVTGPKAKILPDGTAVAPEDAPAIVKKVILAGNEIAKYPYKWGGGHGAWKDNGYDCSGSVSFALAGAGLLKSPLVSGAFMKYGDPGPGEWITIYANGGHMWMVVAGLRFDTSGQGRAGTRWQPAGERSGAGMAVRHPPGF